LALLLERNDTRLRQSKKRPGKGLAFGAQRTIGRRKTKRYVRAVCEAD
jgi:hypothetical protein